MGPRRDGWFTDENLVVTPKGPSEEWGVSIDKQLHGRELHFFETATHVFDHPTRSTQGPIRFNGDMSMPDEKGNYGYLDPALRRQGVWRLEDGWMVPMVDDVPCGMAKRTVGDRIEMGQLKGSYEFNGWRIVSDKNYRAAYVNQEGVAECTLSNGDILYMDRKGKSLSGTRLIKDYPLILEKEDFRSEYPGFTLSRQGDLEITNWASVGGICVDRIMLGKTIKLVRFHFGKMTFYLDETQKCFVNPVVMEEPPEHVVIKELGPLTEVLLGPHQFVVFTESGQVKSI